MSTNNTVQEFNVLEAITYHIAKPEPLKPPAPGKTIPDSSRDFTFVHDVVAQSALNTSAVYHSLKTSCTVNASNARLKAREKHCACENRSFMSSHKPNTIAKWDRIAVDTAGHVDIGVSPRIHEVREGGTEDSTGIGISAIVGCYGDGIVWAEKKIRWGVRSFELPAA